MAECKIIAAVNQKGGVGKSNLSTNLGIGLAQKGKRVLIVDLDSQASQTVSLGWKQPDELPISISKHFGSMIENNKIEPAVGILTHKEGVDLMPSSIELASMEVRMISAMSRETLLKSYLANLKSEYDIIILDCPPALGMMTINALAAADSIIVPVQPEYLSVIGMTQLFDTVARVKEHINPSLKIEGVLFTLTNERTNLAKNTITAIKNAYGDDVRIFSTPIPYSTKVKEASSVGKSIFAYDPNGKAAYAYEKLVEEVLRDGKQRGTDLRASDKKTPCR